MYQRGKVQQRTVPSLSGLVKIRRGVAVALVTLSLGTLASPAVTFAAGLPSVPAVQSQPCDDGVGDSPVMP
jgi:hypothetical protein